jgi:hypothetical protein
MEDYEVRDVLRRATTPELFLTVQPGQLTPGNAQTATQLDLAIGVGNRAPEPANYAVLRLFLDERLSLARSGQFGRAGNVSTPSGEKLMVLSINWGIPSKLPIFREINFLVSEPPLTIFLPNQSTGNQIEYIIGYDILAPGFSTSKFGKLVFRDDSVEINLD